MKKFVSGFGVLLILLLAVVPTYAQLGDNDDAAFIIQNVDSGDAQVLVTFVDEDGNEYTPTPLNDSKPNPFTLGSGDSFQVYLPGIPGLDDGRYSVVVSSDREVVAIANLIGEAGGTFYNGSYAGGTSSSSTVYMASVVHSWYGWYSLVSVQNLGSNPTDITLDITCHDGSTGQLTASDVPASAATHFDLETTRPTGWTSTKPCNGTAVVSSSGEAILAVDNQTAAGGFTQSMSGFESGATVLYIPELYKGHYTWDSSMTILQIGSGTSTVTIDYNDVAGTSDDTCTLTDADPSCFLYMPSDHGPSGSFAATLTSDNLPIIAIVNAANPAGQAQTYEAFGGGAQEVGLPTIMYQFYGWDTAFTCQNVGSSETNLTVSYSNGGATYDHTDDPDLTLAVGENVLIYQPGDANAAISPGYRGSVTVTADGVDDEIVCTVAQTHGANQAAGMGDWSMAYSGFSR
jgi:hypothetical protein